MHSTMLTQLFCLMDLVHPSELGLDSGAGIRQFCACRNTQRLLSSSELPTAPDVSLLRASWPLRDCL